MKAFSLATLACTLVSVLTRPPLHADAQQAVPRDAMAYVLKVDGRVRVKVGAVKSRPLQDQDWLRAAAVVSTTRRCGRAKLLLADDRIVEVDHATPFTVPSIQMSSRAAKGRFARTFAADSQDKNARARIRDRTRRTQVRRGTGREIVPLYPVGQIIPDDLCISWLPLAEPHEYRVVLSPYGSKSRRKREPISLPWQADAHVLLDATRIATLIGKRHTQWTWHVEARPLGKESASQSTRPTVITYLGTKKRASLIQAVTRAKKRELPAEFRPFAALPKLLDNKLESHAFAALFLALRGGATGPRYEDWVDVLARATGFATADVAEALDRAAASRRASDTR